MLKTALKPRWILMLILAMAIASVFVLLSQWQFTSSREEPPPAPSTTEQVRPLTDVLQPLTPLYATAADQMVSLDGEFLPGTQVLVRNRLLEGDEGSWVVQGFAVTPAAGASDAAASPAESASGDTASGDAAAAGAAVIPVVLGWVQEDGDASALPEQEGPASVVGRLLPPEAPEVERPVEGEVPTLSTAELANLWDVRTYSAFVVASDVSVGGVAVPFAADMARVVVGPQPQETPLNWLNIFYAIEWFVFAGFAFFLWWRLVADDHRRMLEDAADAAEEARGALTEGSPGGSSESFDATRTTTPHESGAHRD
ncbi:SURF1 family protein [Arthrobacter sp. N1]|uniref:SURF1 family protein n=1 Tax=Arthrobacter sp. N1 TaxID=619291 RepID=UPI003BAE9188